MTLGSSLDQAVDVGTDVKEILKNIVHAVIEASDKRDDASLRAMVGSMRVSAQIRGISLACLLYMWYQSRSFFGIDDENDWLDHVYETTGYSPQTIRKYIDAWHVVLAAPENIQMAILGKPIEGLMKLIAAVREDQLSENDWEEIAEAPDPASIRAIVKRVRGDATNSASALTLVLRRDGTVTAHKGEDTATVGFLNLEEDNPIVSAAVERIVRSCGMLRE